MANALVSPMTADEFLAWEARQDTKWEFDGFQPVAMNGGTAGHNTIQGNLQLAIRSRLRGGSCRPFGPDMQVPTGNGRYRYPDMLITCVPVAHGARQAPEPVVVFEILSDSTARTDRTTKLLEYRSIPTLQRYVMLEQDQAAATVITRTDHGWAMDVLRAEDTLAMPEIGIELPIAELYLDVELPPLDD